MEQWLAAEAIRDIKFHASTLETKDRHCYDDSRYTSFIPSVLRTRFWISITFSIKYVLIFTAFLFSGLLVYYSFLTIAGLIHRNSKRKDRTLEHYPSVDIFIPAHNEGVVIKDTLEAMAKIEYPGKLTIYLLNDNSQDETPEIGDDFDKAYAHIRHIRVPPGEPKGKSRVLNYGLSISDGEYFCVYDADNQPEPHALRMLVEHAETTEDAVGAVGHVRTVNEKRNWLTRMISLEFQIFQLLMQSGRWLLFQTGSLTGTNMLLRRSALEELGGYDPYAIAEDAELTLRITQKVISYQSSQNQLLGNKNQSI